MRRWAPSSLLKDFRLLFVEKRETARSSPHSLSTWAAVFPRLLRHPNATSDKQRALHEPGEGSQMARKSNVSSCRVPPFFPPLHPTLLPSPSILSFPSPIFCPPLISFHPLLPSSSVLPSSPSLLSFRNTASLWATVQCSQRAECAPQWLSRAAGFTVCCCCCCDPVMTECRHKKGTGSRKSH